MTRPAKPVIAALGAPTLSAPAAALACRPIHDGPPAPRLLIAGPIPTTGISTGPPSCSARLPADHPARNPSNHPRRKNR
ncbi:hypothetical protein ACFCX4_34110 [Kitasatospora sp. NPDC056327]|uniref:hypothetical protein n=1 Tax=Kitasatospora sp. NPDC056327 TaxID=3345785 RepID=UPI0035DBFF7C